MEAEDAVEDTVEDRLDGSSLFSSKNGAEAAVRAVKYDEIDWVVIEEASVLLVDEADVRLNGTLSSLIWSFTGVENLVLMLNIAWDSLLLLQSSVSGVRYRRVGCDDRVFLSDVG